MSFEAPKIENAEAAEQPSTKQEVVNMLDKIDWEEVRKKIEESDDPLSKLRFLAEAKKFDSTRLDYTFGTVEGEIAVSAKEWAAFKKAIQEYKKEATARGDTTPQDYIEGIKDLKMVDPKRFAKEVDISGEEKEEMFRGLAQAKAELEKSAGEKYGYGSALYKYATFAANLQLLFPEDFKVRVVATENFKKIVWPKLVSSLDLWNNKYNYTERRYEFGDFIQRAAAIQRLKPEGYPDIKIKHWKDIKDGLKEVVHPVGALTGTSKRKFDNAGDFAVANSVLGLVK